jgi:3-hydroxyacyl-CoA dehydrogenase/3a,7a,12a-trihydroxy-5b-cholest-24-enoyl-CoA hydratase
VEEGSAPATTTLTIEDAELAAWAAGKADARGLFQRGKLRVDGDVGPIHRLGFVGKL